MVRKLVESKLALAGIAVAVIFTVVGVLLLHASAQAGKGVGGTTTASSTATSTATPSGQTIFVATSTPSASSTGTASSSGTPTGQGGYPGGPGGSPGGPGATPGGTGGTPTHTPTMPGVTPTPTVPSGTPTPTPTPTLPYDFAVVAPLTPAVSTLIEHYPVTVKNTGTNPWDDHALVSFACVSFCPTGQQSFTLARVPPGGTAEVPITLTLPFTWTVATYHSRWQARQYIAPSTLIPFGPTIDLAITRTDAIPRDDQAAPGCANPSGVAWSFVNAGGGNSFTCNGSYLGMRQASSAAPMAVLTTAPGNYTGNGMRVKVHLHFTNAGSDAFAGLGIHVPTSAGTCPYSRFEIRPDGTWRLTSVVGSDCHDASASGSVSPATDYDLWLSVGGNQFFVNGNVVVTGGLQGSGGRLSLSVKSPSGNSGEIRFSNFEYAEGVGTLDTFQASES